MFTDTDYDKLRQIMAESPEHEAIIQKLLDSHKMDVSTISHEIRNPLTLVYSTLQLIESQHPEVTSFKHWAGMREDIEYMNQLLVELSSYNNGERLSLSAVDSVSYLRSIALSFAASIADTDIEFISKIDSSLPPVSCDSMKLKEVLLNLLRNAKDACSKDSSMNIWFHAFCENDTLHITVRDNGCGIPKENLADIFEPFVTHKQGGSGLGLAIARRIVTAHGGSIDVLSEPGAGTMFTVTLPVQ